ncbi:hypothetical protein E2C01_037861 [Portunus trituberculatus]|uniref:Reverse transcriptase domain-containing protein n=1 Tax=Portunus trituberculatus TaxID=210409 RepID=A0A5B7FFQ8_PORTR|nr:hypothetical protein [Portunus trituberculatus]
MELDGVSGCVLKECKEQLLDPIWEMVTSSTGIPTSKGGKSTEQLNYRPVSLTSVVGKICEIVIKEKWVKYLEEEQVILKRQYGFRTGRSCVLNLLSFY